MSAPAARQRRGIAAQPSRLALWRAWLEVAGWLAVAVWLVGSVATSDNQQGSPLTWPVAMVLIVMLLASAALTEWQDGRWSRRYPARVQAGVGILFFLVSWSFPWVVSARAGGDISADPAWPAGYPMLGHPQVVGSLVALTVLAVFGGMNSAARGTLWVCALVLGGLGLTVYWTSPALTVWSNIDTEAWRGPGVAIATTAYLAVLTAAARTKIG